MVQDGRSWYNFTISANFNNFNQFSQFQPNLTISTKFHNFNQFSQFQPIFAISTNFHNFSQCSQIQPNLTISTIFFNFNQFSQCDSPAWSLSYLRPAELYCFILIPVCVSCLHSAFLRSWINHSNRTLHGVKRQEILLPAKAPWEGLVRVKRLVQRGIPLKDDCERGRSRLKHSKPHSNTCGN